jgi:hypothetical protein
VPWPTLNETQAQILKGSLKGAVRGGVVGATASIASGAAVVITAPAWLPWIGGSLLVAAGTMAVWSAVGSSAGAVTGGVWAYIRAKQRDQQFQKMFGK